MGKKPHLNNLDYLFDTCKDFTITGRLYEEKTGVPLPKGKSYLKNGSALAKWANEKGYYIVEITDEPIIERKISFKSKE